MSMILYHFTTTTALGITQPGQIAIGLRWPDGILPHAVADETGSWFCPDNVVWLTADPEPGGDAGFCMRLAVSVNSTDRRLLEFDKWMRGRMRVGKRDKKWLERPQLLVRAQPWRLYFGTIPVAKIVGMVGCHHWPWWWSSLEALEGEAPAALSRRDDSAVISTA